MMISIYCKKDIIETSVKRCPFSPQKGHKTALAQNTHQRLRYIWKKGSRDTQDNITTNQMSTSTIYTSNYKNTLK